MFNSRESWSRDLALFLKFTSPEDYSYQHDNDIGRNRVGKAETLNEQDTRTKSRKVAISDFAKSRVKSLTRGWSNSKKWKSGRESVFADCDLQYEFSALAPNPHINRTGFIERDTRSLDLDFTYLFPKAASVTSSAPFVSDSNCENSSITKKNNDLNCLKYFYLGVEQYELRLSLLKELGLHEKRLRKVSHQLGFSIMRDALQMIEYFYTNEGKVVLDDDLEALLFLDPAADSQPMKERIIELIGTIEKLDDKIHQIRAKYSLKCMNESKDEHPSPV